MLESRKKRFYSRLKQKQQRAGATGDPLDQFGATVRYGSPVVVKMNIYVLDHQSRSRIQISANDLASLRIIG